MSTYERAYNKYLRTLANRERKKAVSLQYNRKPKSMPKAWVWSSTL